MKRKGDAVSGILVLDKAISQGSTQAVAKLKYLFNAQKAGHGGTLDPMATGLLPILFGEATKFANDLLAADKTYEATVLLGVSTDSADAEGHIIDQRPVLCTADDIEAACQQFRGPIEQIPPMHSALKRDGKPLYEYARQGINLELEARKVTIFELTVLAVRLPEVDLRIHCSKGTYVRSIARDIGEAIGCGGHLIALRRTQAGPLNIANAISIDALTELSVPERRQHLLPLDTLLQGLPRLDLNPEMAHRFCQGQRIALADLGLQALSNEPTSENFAQRYRIYRKDHEVVPVLHPFATQRIEHNDTDSQLLGLAHISASALEPARVIHSSQ